MRTSCVCRHCRCPNYAQEGEARGLCLVCERVELWGKNSPAYRGCRCTCRCKLQTEAVLDHEHQHDERGHRHGNTKHDSAATQLLCADCAEQHRSNPRRHRPHGIPHSVVTHNGPHNKHQRRVTSLGIGVGAYKGISSISTPSSKVKERKRPCLTPYARKRYNMIAG